MHQSERSLSINKCKWIKPTNIKTFASQNNHCYCPVLHECLVYEMVSLDPLSNFEETVPNFVKCLHSTLPEAQGNGCAIIQIKKDLKIHYLWCYKMHNERAMEWCSKTDQIRLAQLTNNMRPEHNLARHISCSNKMDPTLLSCKPKVLVSSMPCESLQPTQSSTWIHGRPGNWNLYFCP